MLSYISILLSQPHRELPEVVLHYTGSYTLKISYSYMPMNIVQQLGHWKTNKEEVLTPRYMFHPKIILRVY